MGVGDTRSYATLSIQSVEISAHEIADTIQILDGESQEMGQPVSLRSGAKLAEQSTWQLSSRFGGNGDGVSEGEPISKHIEFFVRLLERKQDAVKILQSKCDFDIWCFVSFERSNHGFDFQHDLMCRLSQFPVNLIFDIYASEGEQSP